MNPQYPDFSAISNPREVQSLCRGSLLELLGIQCTLITPDRVEAVMPVNEHTCQPFGVLHGGASLAMAETIAGIGSLAIIGPAEHAVGQQVSGNHVGVAQLGDTVRGIATLQHKGRSSHVWHVDIFSQSTGRLVSTAQVLYAILKNSVPHSRHDAENA